MEHDTAKAVLDSFLAAQNAGSLDAALALVAPDAVFDVGRGRYEGRDQVGTFVTMLASRHSQTKVLQAQTYGPTVTGLWAQSDDDGRQLGIEWVHLQVEATTHDGRIVRLHARPTPESLAALRAAAEGRDNDLTTEARSVVSKPEEAGAVQIEQKRIPTDVPAAGSVPGLSHDEATAMATVELERWLELLESLAPEDWRRPTACTRWDVRQMVAHVAGAAASDASWPEFFRQRSPRRQRPYRRAGMNVLDAQNEVQVEDRANATPAELIAELRLCGPQAIARRHAFPAPVRGLPLPMGLAFPLGETWVTLGYLLDTILTRDMWMHRMDICRACGRDMQLTPEHDGRITALVARDVARLLGPKLAGHSVIHELTGPAGGTWRIGPGAPAATVRLDALEFHLLASGRLRAEDLACVSLEGNRDLAHQALSQTFAAY